MLKLFYWQRTLNFGDLLSPVIFERIFATPVAYAPPHKADVAAVGSLLSWFVLSGRPLLPQVKRLALLTNRSPITIWGTGMLHDKIIPIPLRKLDIHALRGKNTKAIFAKGKDIALGDPGLLSDRLIEKNTGKKFKVGIVPHHSEKNSKWVPWLKENVKGSTIIDVVNEAMPVVQQISECEMILSSSLHGLIVADSLGIPNHWIMLSDTERANERWKYHDYYSIFENLSIPEPLVVSENNLDEFRKPELSLENYERLGLQQIKENLAKSFPF